MKDAELDRVLEQASKYEPEYLYYLLGSQLLGAGFQAQSAGEAAEVGKDFLTRWREEFRKLVCKKGGVYDQFVRGVVTRNDVPKLVAIAILTGAPKLGGIVISELMAAYLGLLVVQSGIAAYCAGYKEA